MRELIPRLTDSCGCCTLKTGSFVTAFLLLVGSSVQTGFYAFMVDHMYPQKMCKFTYYPKVDYPRRSFYDFLDPPQGIFGYLWPWYFSPPWVSDEDDAGNRTTLYGDDADNRTKSYGDNTGNSTNSYGYDAGNIANLYGDDTGNSATSYGDDAGNSTNSYGDDASNSTNSYGDDAGNSTNVTDWRSSKGRRRNTWLHRPSLGYGWRTYRDPYWNREVVTATEDRPCQRYYRPFEVDSNFLDVDLRALLDKTILYFNIVIWSTMMAATPLLMLAVYKESARLVTAWLVLEALLLMVGTSSTVATAALMFKVVPVSIGIVTLLNLAIHLAIDIYLVMVVFNYRRQLTTKVEDDDTENEQVTV